MKDVTLKYCYSDEDSYIEAEIDIDLDSSVKSIGSKAFYLMSDEIVDMVIDSIKRHNNFDCVGVEVTNKNYSVSYDYKDSCYYFNEIQNNRLLNDKDYTVLVVNNVNVRDKICREIYYELTTNGNTYYFNPVVNGVTCKCCYNVCLPKGGKLLVVCDERDRNFVERLVDFEDYDVIKYY